MSEFIKSLIDEAHVNFLNRNYDESIRQLKSAKLQVDDEILLGRMVKKEQNIDDEYHQRYTQINADDDVEFLNKLMALKEWKNQEYISFYSHINKEIP